MIGSVLSSPSLHHLSLRAILIRRPPKADKRKGARGSCVDLIGVKKSQNYVDVM